MHIIRKENLQKHYQSNFIFNLVAHTEKLKNDASVVEQDDNWLSSDDEEKKPAPKKQ